MPHGTASNRLRKSIMFSLIKQCGFDICYRCKEVIETEKELSIEHKTPWLDSENPKELFFDLGNISFSHLRCNSSAGRRETEEHGYRAYSFRGCRCDICTKANTLMARKKRAKKKERTGRDR